MLPAWMLLLLLQPAPSPVLVIGVDGLGAEGVQASRTPELDALMKRGAYTLRSRAVIPTVSSPNWASHLSGATPAEHGVTSNDWERDRRELPPACSSSESIFPTIVGVLRAQRPAARIVVLHDWDGFGRLVEKGAANVQRHVKGSPAAVEAALEEIKAGWPDLLIVHLDDVDHAGHGQGWGSPAYIKAVEEADSLAGRLIRALPASGHVMVISDHGGREKKHGGMSKAEFEVPWIIAGPRVARGREIRRHVSTIDTAPALARILNLQPHPCWIGRAPEEVFVK